MSTYTTTLTRIYCCIAGRIWRILFLQRASFIFIDYSSEMICCSAITLVHLFNNNDDFVFCLFFFHGFPDAFASTMQPWPKPWSVVTCWDTNVSYKEWWSNYLILAFSFIFFFFMEIFYSSVYKIVWFDHFTHWFLVIGNMSLPSVSITRSLLLNQSFLLCIRRERNLIKKMGRLLSTRKSYPMPTIRYSTNVSRRLPVSNQRWCIFFFLFFTAIVQMLDIYSI